MRNMEAMLPVMVSDWTVVFPNGESESTKRLHVKQVISEHVLNNSDEKLWEYVVVLVATEVKVVEIVWYFVIC